MQQNKQQSQQQQQQQQMNNKQPKEHQTAGHSIPEPLLQAVIFSEDYAKIKSK